MKLTTKYFLLLVLFFASCKKDDQVNHEPDPITPIDSTDRTKPIVLKPILNSTWKIDSVISNDKVLLTDGYIHFYENGLTLSGQLDDQGKIIHSIIQKFNQVSDSSISINNQSLFLKSNRHDFSINKNLAEDTIILTAELNRIKLTRSNIKLNELDKKIVLQENLYNKEWKSGLNADSIYHYLKFNPDSTFNRYSINDYHFLESYETIEFEALANNTILISNENELELDTLFFDISDNKLYLSNSNLKVNEFNGVENEITNLNLEEVNYTTENILLTSNWYLNQLIFEGNPFNTTKYYLHFTENNFLIFGKDKQSLSNVDITINDNILYIWSAIFGSQYSMFKFSGDYLHMKNKTGSYYIFEKAVTDIFD